MGHFSLHGAADFTVRASIANGLEAQGDGPQERRAEDALVTEGEGEQKGNPFLCSDLVLTSHVKKYVFPTVAPVFRQTGGYSLGTLG